MNVIGNVFYNIVVVPVEPFFCDDFFQIRQRGTGDLQIILLHIESIRHFRVAVFPEIDVQSALRNVIVGIILQFVYRSRIALVPHVARLDRIIVFAQPHIIGQEIVVTLRVDTDERTYVPRLFQSDAREIIETVIVVQTAFVTGRSVPADPGIIPVTHHTQIYFTAEFRIDLGGYTLFAASAIVSAIAARAALSAPVADIPVLIEF